MNGTNKEEWIEWYNKRKKEIETEGKCRTWYGYSGRQCRLKVAGIGGPGLPKCKKHLEELKKYLEEKEAK